jgi:hypothetical protein
MLRLPRPARRVVSPRRPLAALLLAACALALPAAPARAGITGLDAFGNIEYNQTSAAAPTTPFGSFFASRINYSASTDITSASGFTGGGVNPLTYAFQPGTAFTFIASTPFITLAQLNTYNTPGTQLSVTTNGGLGAQNAIVTFGLTLYPSAIPALTSSSYNLLQGLNASNAATLNFNNFTAAAGSTSAFTFVTITNVSTGAVAFSQSFLSPSTASAFLAANTLAANTSYNLEIDFSNRAASTIANGSSGFVGQTFTAGYDQRTEIAFTTAAQAVVPEPSSLALTGLGAASAALALRARRRK